MTHHALARQAQIITPCPFFSKWWTQNLDLRYVLVRCYRDMIWSQHLGYFGQNTSRIQNEDIYATLYVQANAIVFIPDY